MAGDEDDGGGRRRRMDLNLYLGLPLSPLSHTGDLGSSLALSPLRLSPPPPAAVLEQDYLLDTPLDPVPPPAGYEHLVPYSPDSPPANPSVGSHDTADLAPDLPIPPTADEPSPRAEYLQHLESRLHRTAEVNPRPTFRRFRRSYNLNALDDIPRSPSERLVQDIMSSQRDLQASWKRRGRAEVAVAESEGDLEEKLRGAANFECNVCLDMAKDPVVTRCGHLFCWACLYQWLHFYCDHNECPVCKGLVDEAQITPIYGRGCSKTTDKEKCGVEDGGIEVKIPPRPRGHRTEGWRQRFHRSAAGRRGGLLPPGSSVLDEIDLHMHRVLVGGSRSSLARLLRRQIREVSTESGSNSQGLGSPREEMAGPLVNSTSLLIQDEILEGFTNRLAAISVDLRGALRTLRTVSGQAGPSTSSTNHHDTESWPPWETTVAADQASVSSTMAVIQEEIPANDASAEPYSAGSSRDVRRRGWSSTTGSLDVDGDELHSRKRRRLN